MINNVQLVQTTTKDDFILNGIYSDGDKNSEAIIFIHGFTGDFYTHKFIHTIGQALQDWQKAFVLAQTRGTGIQTEIIKSNRAEEEYIGSFFEKIEDSHLDISGWIKFLVEQGYRKIILMGHSLGTIKSVRYLFEGEYKDRVTKLILLAPFDKNSYVEKKTKGEWKEHLKIAEQKIKEGKELERIPNTFDDFPMTYRTYYSSYKQDDFGCMFDFYRKDYNFPILNQINIPVTTIVGDLDEFLYMKEFNKDGNEIGEILKKNIKDSEFNLIPGAAHTFVGKEDEVTNLVLKFI